MGRAPCCDKVGLKKGRWTVEEDDILTKYIQANGEGSWRSLPKNAGLLRCGKSCRLRWINYLKSDLKRGNISAQEEDIIIKLHASLGNKWSVIAGQLAGRTDNEIKNYWNSHLSRKIDTFRRPNSEPLPLPILANLEANAAALKRKGGGRTSRAAMKKNKITKTGDTKPDQSVLENGNQLFGLPISYQEKVGEAIILGFGEDKEEGNLMVCCPNTSNIDDAETSDQLMMGPIHEEGGILSCHDINIEGINNNNINVDFLDSVELCENFEIGGTLSSNEGSNGGGEKMSWSSATSYNMEDSKIDWEWEEFVNENLWTNYDQEKDNDKQLQLQDQEILSWLWDKDNNIIGISEDQGENVINQGDNNNIVQEMESGKKDALVAWLFS